jgi:hypothetical protein
MNSRKWDNFELYAMDKAQGTLRMCNNLNNLDNGWKQGSWKIQQGAK